MKTTFSIWYMKPEFFRDGIMGMGWLREHGPMPDPKQLEKTHVHLMDLDYADDDYVTDKLEAIWTHMQGEVWSPNGEARPLIASKGLQHTSMSMGDIIAVNGRAYIADAVGFVELPS